MTATPSQERDELMARDMLSMITEGGITTSLLLGTTSLPRAEVVGACGLPGYPSHVKKSIFFTGM